MANDEQVPAIRALHAQCTGAECADIRTLLDRIQADAKHIDELERITGPVLPCGCYAFEMMAHGTLPGHSYCEWHKVIHEPTPEYLAWRSSR